MILDDLSTGRAEFVEGRTWYRGRVDDGELIDRIFAEHPDIVAAVGCAAKIVVPESVANPLYYYAENVARTKAHFESVLEDTTVGTDLRAVSLRYFNPIGAEPEGIGADPEGRTGLQVRRPTHALELMIDSTTPHEPYPVTGTDWETRDGSGIRDYVHVWDLAGAHVAALRRFDTITQGDSGYRVINLGSGTGTTVLELIKAFENVTGKPLPTTVAARRPGDNAGAYPDIALAAHLLGWKPSLTVEEGIADSLAWYERRNTVLQRRS